MKQEQAAAVGRDALIWIAAEPDLLGAFLAGSGLAPHEIRTRAEDAEFLGFVLDFVRAGRRGARPRGAWRWQSALDLRRPQPSL
jgi:hypothetical protein